MSSSPCTWCEREDQATCPDCKGTGFIKVDDQLIGLQPSDSQSQDKGHSKAQKSNQTPDLREAMAKVLQQQWAAAYKAGQNGKMLAQLITEPIIEDATLNKLEQLLQAELAKAEKAAVEANQIELANWITKHLKDGNLEKVLVDRLKSLEKELADER